MVTQRLYGFNPYLYDRYHTKCIGITQKAAKKLDEYVCEACLDKEPKTGKGEYRWIGTGMMSEGLRR